MKWRLYLSTLVVALATARAPAQETRHYPLIGEATLSADGKTLTPASELVRQRYEEIEIMARLLDRGLGKLAGLGFHGDVHAVAFSPDGKLLASGVDGTVRLWDVATGRQLGAHAAVEFPNMQGVYLKGQGIVFTATVPLLSQKPVTGPGKPAPKALTEWERVRKELRGEKVDGEKAKEADDTSLADAVLKVLADNGKNLTRLPEEESVTVALTLLPAEACTNCHAKASSGGSMGAMMGGGSGGMMGPGMGAGRGNRGRGGPAGGGGGSLGSGSGPGLGSPPGSPAAGGGGSAGVPAGAADSHPDTAETLAEFRKYALMGDLALKQKDYQHAADALQKASKYTVLPVDPVTEMEYVEAATKLVRALTALGKSEEAQRAVEGIAQLSERIKAMGRARQPAEKKADAALPAKLVITVPKKLLDRADKVSSDEFRKAASVEHLTFDRP